MADIVWKTTQLPDAIVGAPYQAGLGTTGQATALTAASAVGLPASGNLTVTLANGSFISGTPTHIDVGSYSVTVTLTDTAGASASGTLLLNVRYADTANVQASDYAALKNSGGVFGAEESRKWPLSH